MAKDDVIEIDGKVIEALPNATFRVELPVWVLGKRKPFKDIYIASRIINNKPMIPFGNE